MLKLITAALLYLMLAANAIAAPIETQTNGTTWYDTDQNMLDAKPTGYIKVGDFYYAFGNKRYKEDATFEYRFRAINCYRSRNLRDWDFCGEVLSLDDFPEKNFVASRPKVIYNAQTKRYVLWMKYKKYRGGDDKDRHFIVASSDRIDGQYRYLHQTQGTQGDSGDMSLYTEGNRAYVVYSKAFGRDIIIDQLTGDFTNIQRNIAVIPAKREAPLLIRRNGYYFILASGVTGWRANQGRYVVSRSLDSGWSDWRTFGDRYTYDSQGSDILVVQGSRATSYIFSGDRWSNDYLGESTKLWLPISFNGDTLKVDYRDSFIIDAQTGVWSPAPAKQYYRITSRHSGKALAIFRANIAGVRSGMDGNHIDVGLDEFDPNDARFLWEIEATGGGYSKIVNKFSGKALTPLKFTIDGITPRERDRNFVEIGQWWFNNHQDFYHWRFDPLSNGYVAIINKYSGRAANVFARNLDGSPGDRSANGADVGQQTLNPDRDWFHWRVERVQ